MDKHDTVTLVAPEGATDLSIGAANYPVKGGKVTIPRGLAHHAYAFGYTNAPQDQAAIEAEAERVRKAQAEMDAANGQDTGAGADPGTLAAFLGREAAEVIADLPSLPDADLTAAEEAEIAGQAREDVAAAIEAERARRAG